MIEIVFLVLSSADPCTVLRTTYRATGCCSSCVDPRSFVEMVEFEFSNQSRAEWEAVPLKRWEIDYSVAWDDANSNVLLTVFDPMDAANIFTSSSSFFARVHASFPKIRAFLGSRTDFSIPGLQSGAYTVYRFTPS